MQKKSRRLAGKVFVDLRLASADHARGVSVGQAGFFGDLLDGVAVQEAADHHLPVPIRVVADDPFMDKRFDLAVTQVVGDFNHFADTQPVPPHAGHGFVAGGLVPFRTRTLTVRV